MRSIEKYKMRRFWSGVVAGLGAGIIATILMLLLHQALGTISLPEVVGSRLTTLLSPDLFTRLHELIGGDAKLYLFYGVVVGQCLLFALAGGLANRFARLANDISHWRLASLLGAGLWLFAGLILLPISGAGIFGMDLVVGIGSTMLVLALIALSFAAAFALTLEVLNVTRLAEIPVKEKGITEISESGEAQQGIEEDELPEEEYAGASLPLSRRALLKRGAIIAGIAVAGVAAIKFIGDGLGSGIGNISGTVKSAARKIVPAPKPNYGELAPVVSQSIEITPTNQFYVVSKNLFSDPNVNVNGWSMRIDGAVEHPYTLNYSELLQQPMQTQYESLMCISNEVGGEYMSNAQWEGIRLETLLNKAGIKPGASKVVLHAVDDYSDSIHMAKALEPTTVVAVRMNGAQLPPGHGFPARLLVPGIYGMKHVKWINRIEVTNQDYQGYWQQRGWSDPAPLKMTSRIDTPKQNQHMEVGPRYIAGVAFSGNKGISEVDVSLDGGKTWQRATLKQPSSQMSWVLWQLNWNATGGAHIIAVRAIDLEGNVQDPTTAPPQPDGSSGYHTINVTVG